MRRPAAAAAVLRCCNFVKDSYFYFFFFVQARRVMAVAPLERGYAAHHGGIHHLRCLMLIASIVGNSVELVRIHT